MAIIDTLLSPLEDAEVVDVVIGMNWTGVVVERQGVRSCGLASTLRGDRGGPRVPQAGKLHTLSGRELASHAKDAKSPTMASVGVAALNALLPPPAADRLQEANAAAVLAQRGAGKKVGLIGHFPFAPALRSQVGHLAVLEQEPRGDELPAEAAAEVLPQCDLVAITGMALVNGSLASLLALCPREAVVMVLGPSTPLSPRMFEHGVDIISGAIVTEIERVLAVLRQGGNFRQIHQAGVRLVNMHRETANESRRRQ
jgi:uncharacterized protein (DUF4213/DUF364 family)